MTYTSVIEHGRVLFDVSYELPDCALEPVLCHDSLLVLLDSGNLKYIFTHYNWFTSKNIFLWNSLLLTILFTVHTISKGHKESPSKSLRYNTVETEWTKVCGLYTLNQAILLFLTGQLIAL